MSLTSVRGWKIGLKNKNWSVSIYLGFCLLHLADSKTNINFNDT